MVYDLIGNVTADTKVGIFVAIGVVAAAGLVAKLLFSQKSQEEAYSQKKKTAVALNSKDYQKFKLREKVIINHNTRLFRFDLPNPDDILGLPIGQHLSIKAVVEGKEIYRSYTPVSSDDEIGYFDLIIKVYEKGLMSRHIDGLKIGDHLDIRGPKGQFIYQPNMVRAVGMLAGGTGITPMLQIIRAILKNPKDKTQISLVFANVNEDDILLRKDLDELVTKHSNFKIYYVLNNPPQRWTGGVGFVSKDMIDKHLPKQANDIRILLCGPPPMNKAMQQHLIDLGYTEEHTFTF